jgi:four helix bundle protein
MKGRAAESFEDLHIYQRVRELVNGVYSLTREPLFSRDLGLVDQIRRVSVSVLSNIAEGFERGGTCEFIQFLYVAKGSCGEVRAQLQVAHDQGYASAESYARLHDRCPRLGGMISNFIAHLQRSNYSGEKSTRPRRQAAEAARGYQDALRAAQLANMRAGDQQTVADP